jgi:hypothetical protein
MDDQRLSAELKSFTWAQHTVIFRIDNPFSWVNPYVH